jgi:predicted ATPase/DNA-binding SARP family transcriptional activator
VAVDGVELASALRGRQVPLLFAYLVLDREREIGREELSLALWPERAPRSQDAALRTLLSRLRTALSASALRGREQLSLALPEPVWIDVEAAAHGLERAREALGAGDAPSAWARAQVPLNIAGRGLLPGFDAAWLERRRRELGELRLDALEVVGRAGLALGGHQLQSAIRAARALIDEQPYRETGYVLLMQVLAAEGNVAEALRVFERLRTLLRDELGTAPSPDAIAAHERLLNPARAPVRAIRPAPQIDLPPELGAPSPIELVGRADELDELWAVIRGRDCEPATARVGLIAGEPGIGKTRLLVELARRLHAKGGIVLAGRCTQETLAPYQPFLEGLRHYVLHAPADHLRTTAEVHAGELQLLLPELRRRIGDLPPPQAGAAELERYRLFEAVAGLLGAIAAATPVLVVLDDLHWADRPTLLLLHHLARAPELEKVSIVGAYRAADTEPAGPLTDTLRDLRHDQLVSELRLDGLPQPDTAELVRARTGTLPPRPLVRALHHQTEGNPLFILQTVRQLLEAGAELASAGPADLQALGLPEDLKRVIAQRLAGLDPATAEWLRVAAVIGRDFDTVVLERVSSLDEDQFMAALEQALDAGVVVPQRAASPAAGFSYSFSHPLIRETLYEGIVAPRRARLHRRVGEALEQLDGHARSDERVAMLAQHFARAAEREDAAKAIGYARLAGERATEMLAYEEAAEHYARALEVQERFEPDELRLRLELLLVLGESRVRSGDRPLAWRPLREAADIAIQLSDADSLGRAAVAASRRYVQQPGVVDEELIALLERALELTAGQATTLRVRLLARMCGALYYSQERERMASLSAEATEIASKLGEPEGRALAAAARRRAFWTPAHIEQRLVDSAEVLRAAREADDLELALQGHAWLVVDLLESGEIDAVDAQIDAFDEGARRLRQPLYEWQAGVWRAMRALLTGRLGEAETLAEQALAIGARAEEVTAAQYYAIQLLSIRRAQGRMSELEPGIRQLLERFPNRLAYRAALGVLLAETGKLDQMARELEPLAADGFAGIPRDGDWLVAMTLLSDAYAELGDAEHASTLYELLEPFERANVVVAFGVSCEGAVARLLGRLAAVAGRPDAATEHFERALEREAALRAPVCLARTQLDYAQALPGHRELVDAAARTAQSLGLEALARRAASLPSPNSWPRPSS